MTDFKYKIGIIGGGSVGLVYAALLADKAEIIVKTRRQAQAEQIKTRGINLIERLETPLESKNTNKSIIKGIFASANIKDLADCDAVIVTVKSYDTEVVAKELSRVLKKDSEILTLQNGLQALGILKSNIKFPDRIFAGVTHIGASRLDDRSVTVGHNLRTFVDSKAKVLTKVLETTRFEFVSSVNINQVVWDKMVLSTGQLALGAITNLTLGEMGESIECLEIAEKLLDEFMLVANAEGITFDYSFMDKVRDNWKMSKHHPSMWQDLQSKKKTEIDAINGAISALGKKYKIATPYNDLITSLIKVIEVK